MKFKTLRHDRHPHHMDPHRSDLRAAWLRERFREQMLSAHSLVLVIASSHTTPRQR